MEGLRLPRSPAAEVVIRRVRSLRKPGCQLHGPRYVMRGFSGGVCCDVYCAAHGQESSDFFGLWQATVGAAPSTRDSRRAVLFQWWVTLPWRVTAAGWLESAGPLRFRFLIFQHSQTITRDTVRLSFLLPCVSYISTISLSAGVRELRGASGVRGMASGFNTEIEFEGTRFHIQTEARKEAGIETAVYVKGAVVHSLKTSHQDLFNESVAGEQELAMLLEEQHRQVIARVRAGEIKLPSKPVSGSGLLES